MSKVFVHHVGLPWCPEFWYCAKHHQYVRQHCLGFGEYDEETDSRPRVNRCREIPNPGSAAKCLECRSKVERTLEVIAEILEGMTGER